MDLVLVIAIQVNLQCMLELLLRYVYNVIGSFDWVAAVCILKHSQLVYDFHPVVVIFAPYSLFMVLDIRIVVSTLNDAFMDAYPVNMIRLVLQVQVLILQL